MQAILTVSARKTIIKLRIGNFGGQKDDVLRVKSRKLCDGAET